MKKRFFMYLITIVFVMTAIFAFSACSKDIPDTTVPTPSEKEIQNVTLKTVPTKTLYAIDEKINLAGGWITVGYSDSTQEEINLATIEVTTVYNFSTPGTKSVSIVYEGFAVKFSVTVQNLLAGINVKSMLQTIYYPGEDLTFAGVLQLYYSDGDVAEIALSEEMFEERQAPLEGGERNLHISYGGFSTEFAIKVNSSTITGYTFKSPPKNLVCLWNESFDTTGGVLTRAYADGDVVDVPLKTSMLASQTATAVTAETDYTDQIVNVLSPSSGLSIGSLTFKVYNPPVSLTLKSNPTKTSYNYYEKIVNDIEPGVTPDGSLEVVTGATVQATRKNGFTDPIVNVTGDMLNCTRATKPASGTIGTTTATQTIRVTYMRGSYPERKRYAEAYTYFDITVTDAYTFVLKTVPAAVKPEARFIQNASLDFTGLELYIGHKSGVIDDNAPVLDLSMLNVRYNTAPASGSRYLEFSAKSGYSNYYGTDFSSYKRVLIPTQLNPLWNTPQLTEYRIHKV